MADQTRPHFAAGRGRLRRADRRLLALAQGLGQPALASRLVEVAGVLTDTTSDLALHASLNLGLRFETGGPVVTLSFDPVRGQPNEAAWRSGLATSCRLVTRLGADPWQLGEVQHLFCPTPTIPVAFAIRYRAEIRVGGEVTFSAVVNPNVMGHEGASQLIARACQLLGIKRPGALCRAAGGSRAEYLALELAPPPIARVEVGTLESWFLHQRAERPFTGTTPFSVGQIADWLAILAVSGARGRVPVRTRLTVGREHDIVSACLLLPLGRYADSDLSALEGVKRFLDSDNAGRLERCIVGLTSRPLASTRGTFDWVGFSARDAASSLVQVDLASNP